MSLGPWLVTRGLILGNLVVILLTSLFWTDASPAAAHEAAGAPQTMIGILEQIPAQPGECDVSDAFPDSVRQWCSLITQYSSQHGLDPDLVAAVVWQESGGDPLAYSRSGAVGLMQVMPRDGLAAEFMCVNGPCFAKRPSSEQLRDPAFNVGYGTRMLAGLFQRHGNIRDALKAYGPMDRGYSYADKVLALYPTGRTICPSKVMEM